MKKIAVLLALVICLAVFSACGENPIVGKWTTLEASDIAIVAMTYNFQKGGKLTISALFSETDGSYKIDGDKLIIKADVAGIESEEVYNYELNGDMLTLKNAESGEVTKLERIKD